jgi:hypothetical protein
MYTMDDVIGCAFDLDAGTVPFYKNGSSRLILHYGSPCLAVIPGSTQSAPDTWSVNFGQRPFAYPHKRLQGTVHHQPAGATSADGSRVMMDVKYTRATAQINIQSLSGLNFEPDFGVD